MMLLFAAFCFPSMNNAFVNQEGIGGVCRWEDYPYHVGHKHWIKGCRRHTHDVVSGFDISGFVNITWSDIRLIEALAIQPMSVMIDSAAVSLFS